MKPDSGAQWTFIEESVAQAGMMRYCLFEKRKPLTYSEVVAKWQHNADFRGFFNTILRQSPFVAYRWETPAFSEQHMHRLFEFILVDYPRLATRRSDRETFGQYFAQVTCEINHGIVSFPNLNGDCQLIVPSPATADDVYGHLAVFVRQAPAEQVDSLWRTVGQTMAERISKKSTWLSTAGGGVAWLHVRLDHSPKYYAFTPYRRSAEV